MASMAATASVRRRNVTNAKPCVLYETGSFAHLAEVQEPNSEKAVSNCSSVTSGDRLPTNRQN